MAMECVFKSGEAEIGQASLCLSYRIEAYLCILSNSMDMCTPYILEVKVRAPQAEIAFDPFHVVKLGNEAVQEVRRSEARERKGSAEAAVVKGLRWARALLRAPEKLGDEEQMRLSAVADLNARVYRAYLLKEELRVRGWIDEAKASLTAASHRQSGSLFVHRVHVAGRRGVYQVGLADP